MFEQLLSPITINGVTFPNRTVVPAMVSCYCNEDGTATDQYIAFHTARAKGGWGMIITEDYAVDKGGKAYKYLAGLWEDAQIPSHRRLTDSVHEAGGKLIAQIYHCGRKTKSAITGSLPKAPSPIPNLKGVEVPQELTIPEIEELVERFGDAALRAKRAGFDGVEIHGAHGYLIGQFASPSANFRTDRYGGGMLGRLRFPLEVIRKVRERVGADYLVGYRISADEKILGGYTLEDTKAIVPYLVEAGIDFLDVSAGTGDGYWIIPPASTPSAWLAQATREIKALVDIPVITVGRINEPHVAAGVLRSGCADMVAMGRAALIDPEFPNKVRENRLEDIRRCIGCNVGCTGGIYANVPISCVLNPELGQEERGGIHTAIKPLRVAVIGAGPGGLEAARACALAGHRVTVYEEDCAAGGQLRAAAAVPCKGEIAAFVRWQLNQLERLGVPLHLGVPVKPALLREHPADAVIVATGSRPALLEIPGVDLPHVITARDLLAGKVIIGANTVVIGGGQSGSGAALYLGLLAKNALERRVTLVEAGPDFATDENLHNKLALVDNLQSARVRVLTNTRALEITGSGVRVEGSLTGTIPADTVVIATGSVPDSTLAGQLRAQGHRVLVIGDAREARTAQQAIAEGYETAALLEEREARDV